MFRTIILGLIVNIAIMMILSFFIQFFGLHQLMLQYLGGGYTSLFALCLFWGMGGAFISLLLSKWMAKTFFGVKIITPTGEYGAIVRKIHEIARRSGMREMPEVGIYMSNDLNAFATGSSKNNSLLAVSSGLLETLNEEEMEGVIGHEIAHIVNGDMVTMTVVQGIVNAFVMFFAYIIAEIIDRALSRDDEGGGLGFFAHFIVRQLLMMVLGLLAYPIVAGFSRWREYRADSGSGNIVGKHKMIKALEALKAAYPRLEEAATQDKKMYGRKRPQATMSISSKSAIFELMSTHPPLDKRINALKLN